MLTMKELELIDSMTSLIWQPTPWERMSQDDWVDLVLANGLKNIQSDLNVIYNARGALLSKVASVTTKRLQILRKIEGKAGVRKADVKIDDLEVLLMARPDPVATMVQEIMSLDPDGNLFLRDYFLGYTSQTTTGPKAGVMAEVEKLLRLEVYNSNIYSDMYRKMQLSELQLQTMKEKAEDLMARKEAIHDNLTRLLGAEKAKKWHSNVQEFDPIGYLSIKKPIKQKPKTTGMGLHPSIVPHSSKKPKVKTSTDIAYDLHRLEVGKTFSTAFLTHKKALPDGEARLEAAKQTWESHGDLPSSFSKLLTILRNNGGEWEEAVASWGSPDESGDPEA